MKQMLRLFLAVLLLMIPDLAIGQYVFHQIDVRSGLPDNYVRSILRDRNGYVWIGTQNGLCRYDGYDCQPYAIRSQQGSDDNIKRVEEDATGQIWVTTLSDNLYIYNAQADRMEDGSQARLARLGIRVGSEVPHVFVDTNKNLWVTVGKSLYYYTFSQERRYQFRLPMHVQQVVSDGMRAFVLLANGQVAEVMMHSGKLLAMGAVPNDGTGSMVMYQDGERALWFYDSDKGGLYRMDLTVPKSPVKKVWDENVTAMHAAADGRLWIGTNSSGLACMDATGRLVKRVNREEGNAYSLVSNHVNCLYVDAKNNLWVGTSKAGVALANLTRSHVQLVNTHFTEDVSSFLSDGKALWVGYDGRGLTRLNADDRVAEVYSRGNGKIVNDLVIGACQTTDGRIWFMTYGGGVMQWTDGRMTQPTWGKAPSVRFARHVVQDRHGNLWVGSVKSGLTRIDAQGGLRHFTFENSPMPTNAITDMEYAKAQRRIYIATSSGLCYVDDTGHVKGAGQHGDEDSTLATLAATTMLVTKTGWLWVGTAKGLVPFTPTLKKAVLKGDALPAGPVLAIAEDHRGNVWFTTNDKIVQLAPQYTRQQVRLRAKVYSAYDGTGGLLFSKYALYATPSGEVLAGGTGAFVRIKPTYQWITTRQAKLEFTQLWVNNQQVAVQRELLDGRQVLNQPLRLTDQVKLRWDDDFTIAVSALDYGNGNVRFEYQLDEGAWVLADGNRIHFSHLAEGTHQLRVRTQQGNVQASGMMTLIITPPLWRSAGAYVLYLLLLVLAAWGVGQLFKERRRTARQKKALQEERAQQQRLDEAKMKFMTNVGHDLRTPLSLIISPVEQLLQKGVSQDSKGTLELVLRHAKQLLDQVNQLLDMRHLENNDKTLVLTEGDLTEFVEETCKPYQVLAEKAQIKLKIDGGKQHVLAAFDKDKLRSIVVNLLSNALKYNRKGGQVTVGLWQDEDGVHLQVADTGIGIKPENKERIFERFFQEEHADESMTGSGIGLHIVKEYVDLMGGTIRVTDNVPHGTVMMVVLPHTRPLEPTVTALAGQTSEASDAGGEARYTVLIVEDNADLRQFITDVLDEEYATLQAGDGVEAMEILAAKRVNMVISDIMMPRMDGMQLCQRIKTDVNLSHIPVMMLTAKTADEHVISGYREGADDYITKPFNPAILKLRIRKIFDWMEAAHEQMKDPETSVPDLGMSEIDRKLLERATQLVESHLADYTFSVEEFSAEMGMSRSALYKKLMALTGRSPLEFMRTIKLRQGYSLLMKGEGNVSEIAYRIGLSPKQFAHFFKEIYGVLPSKVRNGKS